MSYFFYKLISPRPTFPMDMTDTEKTIMQEHSEYWTNLMKKNKVVVFGPVMDPKGGFGIAVVEADDETSALNFADNDPAIKSNAGFSFEIHPMPGATFRT